MPSSFESKHREPDDEVRIIPTVRIRHFVAPGPPSFDGEPTWCSGGHVEVRDGTGTPLIGWLDNDLDYTFNEIRKDGQIDTEDVYVSISRHRRSDGTTLVTWTDETGAKELTFLGPAYEQAWEEAEEQTVKSPEVV